MGGGDEAGQALIRFDTLDGSILTPLARARVGPIQLTVWWYTPYSRGKHFSNLNKLLRDCVFRLLELSSMITIGASLGLETNQKPVQQEPREREPLRLGISISSDQLK